jgi:hypothetical protein
MDLTEPQKEALKFGIDQAELESHGRWASNFMHGEKIYQAYANSLRELLGDMEYGKLDSIHVKGEVGRLAKVARAEETPGYEWVRCDYPPTIFEGYCVSGSEKIGGVTWGVVSDGNPAFSTTLGSFHTLIEAKKALIQAFEKQKKEK